MGGIKIYVILIRGFFFMYNFFWGVGAPNPHVSSRVNCKLCHVGPLTSSLIILLPTPKSIPVLSPHPHLHYHQGLLLRTQGNQRVQLCKSSKAVFSQGCVLLPVFSCRAWLSSERIPLVSSQPLVGKSEHRGSQAFVSALSP